MAATASSTRAAFSVQTSGRNRPVASANPAIAPVASAVGVSLTAKTVPEVPTEITTSPAAAPRPSAAAALSPAPGPSRIGPARRDPAGGGLASRHLSRRLGGTEHARDGRFAPQARRSRSGR